MQEQIKNNELIIIDPLYTDTEHTKRLRKVVDHSTEGVECLRLSSVDEVVAADRDGLLKNKRLLFTISLGESGINLRWYEIMRHLRLNPKCLEGSIGGVILDGKSEFYTKSVGRSLVFTANMAGCTFPGRCLVEGTGTLRNYNIQAQNLKTDNFGAYLYAAKDLVERVISYEPLYYEKPKILALHAGSQKTSNSLALWSMAASQLEDMDIMEVSLRNGHVIDCRGCSYEVCKHFGEEGNCYYGGPIVNKAFPAVLECNAIVMICPNYNDALGANLTAFVNRLTALFTTRRFYDKKMFGVVVSGYSGGDIVAEQLISGLNMNKSFCLPERFAIMETANDPLEIMKLDCIEEKASDFADRIRYQLTGVHQRTATQTTGKKR